ncbi:phosphoglycolate phosphatase [Sphaerisporangium krabiense]|uniref:AHBA synthesis associated protein n=1 Tax=Sphaerisporangium krabiense TaxID=763782 RepID=A0A7W8Z6M2_9ACTN|nr:HAD-IA family hydrolase [Sphaerisporangium krabiense]MBB5628441.1 AHBA synthesis associated protein [Sphaerisporangium krabiense]GII66820.1 phosphoglycolate phosphatase [Sphaerisporangium krabiense]
MGAAQRDFHAVVFDLDGVLVDSFAVMREAFSAAYAEVVGPGAPPFEEYSRHLGLYFPDIMRMMGLPPEMEEPFIEASRRLTGRVRVYDGVPEMLASLRDAGLVTGVATGKHGWRARALLEAVGLSPLLDVVIGSDEVSRPKPAPDIVQACLDKLGVPPGQAMYVGDAPADMRSARAASVLAVAALWGGDGQGPEALLAERPGLVCARPSDVVAAAVTGDA